MNPERALAIAKVSNDLWNDNLWYRKLTQDEKDAVAFTVWIMRKDRIKGKFRFAETMNAEIQALLKTK